MKTAPNVLIDVLKRERNSIILKPKTLFNTITQEMNDRYNVSMGIATSILNGRTPLDTLPVDMLYKFTQVLYDIYEENQLQNNLLNPECYFYEKEVKSFSAKVKKGVLGKIIIKNVSKLTDDMYSAVVPVDEILKWRNNMRVHYNPETQRYLTEYEKDGLVYKEITVYQEAIDDMRRLMETGEFFPCDITLNANPAVSLGMTYNNGTLTIDEDTVLDIIDGYHQYFSMTGVKIANPEFEFNETVYFTMFDDEKANRYIIQKNKKNHLTEMQEKLNDTTKNTNILKNRLLDNSKSLLKTKQLDKDMQFELLLLIEIFFDDINNNKDPRKLNDLYLKIMNGFNYTIEKYNYEIEITKGVIFVLFNIISQTDDIEKYIDAIDIIKVANAIEYKSNPIKSNYDYVKKVIKNVQ